MSCDPVDGQRWVEFTLPVARDNFIRIGGLFPISAEEWGRLMHLLDLFRPGLVREEQW